MIDDKMPDLKGGAVLHSAIELLSLLTVVVNFSFDFRTGE